MSIPKAVMWGCVAGFILRSAIPAINFPQVNGPPAVQSPAVQNVQSASRGLELKINGTQSQLWLKVTTAKSATQAEGQQ